MFHVILDCAYALISKYNREFKKIESLKKGWKGVFNNTSYQKKYKQIQKQIKKNGL